MQRIVVLPLFQKASRGVLAARRLALRVARELQCKDQRRCAPRGWSSARRLASSRRRWRCSAARGRCRTPSAGRTPSACAPRGPPSPIPDPRVRRSPWDAVGARRDLCASPQPEPSPKIAALVDQIAALTLLEASELTDALKVRSMRPHTHAHAHARASVRCRCCCARRALAKPPVCPRAPSGRSASASAAR